MSRRIPLSRGKFTLVSDEDYERVSQHKWTYDAGYVCRKVTWRDDEGNKCTRKVLLHRFILDAPVGMDVDHRNWNGLDNRRCNLRLATRVQNSANARPRTTSTSKYKGVSFHKRDQAWQSRIAAGGDYRHLGTFRSEDEAALAYDRAAFGAWGEFAYLNFPQQLTLP